MKNLIVRSFSGIIYVALILGSIYLGQAYFMSLMALFAGLAIIEFQKMTFGKDKIKFLPIAADVVIAISLVVGSLFCKTFILALFLGIFRLVMELYLKNANPLKSLALSLMSYIYIGLPLFLISYFYKLNGPMMTLFVFLFIWINDTGAFIVGCSFGKHRLFERISPKKSWEGFFGGLLLNVVVAILLSYIYIPNGFIVDLAVIVTIFATWGDLIESMIKRTLNVKDSGNIIPGHGGILDRIDSLLLVFPAVLLYCIVCSSLI